MKFTAATKYTERISLNTQQLHLYMHLSGGFISCNYRFINGFHVQGKINQNTTTVSCYQSTIWDNN